MSIETRHIERDRLYSLLSIKIMNPDLKIKGLDEAINRDMATMEQDDVKIVQQMISELMV